jgi:hypothetical protein
MRVYLVQVIALLSAAAPLQAQEPQDSLRISVAAADSVSFDSVAAGARYRKGWVHTGLVGSGYRRQWATPIPVEVLDLHRYAGGLRAVQRGGGMQTTALHFEAADGRKFDFRSVDKDGTSTLPPELRRSIVGRTWQDQVSASYPAGALVAPPLLEAAGVLTPRPRLFVMPDDPALGKFRKDFAGMVGTLEERPTLRSGEHSSYQGIRKIANTDELYERLTRNPEEQVDSRAFLAARLMDVYLGDADRGEQQWRWLKLSDAEGAPWEPLPYDRDYVFVRFRGLLPDIVRLHDPRLVDFRDHYPSMVGLNWRARFIDRRLLGGLDWATWDSVAHALTTRLTDSVIDLATRQLPPRYAAEDGAWLARSLRRRRDQLPEAAREFYRMIAFDAEVYATDASETVVATRGPNGTLDLAIFARDEAPGDHPYFHRGFDAKTTKEVRLFLNAGADSVLVRGTGGGPRLRVIADGQAKVVSDEGGRTNVYGPRRSVTVGGRHPPSVDHRPYQPPDSTSDVPAAPRDWGHWWTVGPWTGASTEQGTVLGVGVTRFGYGFRRNPYALRLDLRSGYAINAGAFASEIRADLRQENSETHFLFRGLALQGDTRRFFGFGNQTPFTSSNTFYRTFQHQYQVSAAVGWSLARHLTAQAGPVLKYSTSDFNQATLLSEVRPYGSGRFGELGAQAALTFDSRDTAAAPTRGAHVTVGGSLYPALWDVTSTFGELHGEAATYLSARLPLRPTLALRAGGKRVWGTHPFQEGAYIGGGTTVRGLYTGRFLGDASAYGNAELRLRLTSFNIFAPGEMGVFGLGDVGRVWLTGESSNTWHTAFGGGLWFAYLNRSNTVSVALAHGDGRTTVYLRTGFMF